MLWFCGIMVLWRGNHNTITPKCHNTCSIRIFNTEELSHCYSCLFNALFQRRRKNNLFEYV